MFVWSGVGDGDLYTQLWKLCAGPLVDVPRQGERVFYFPQGHMEQVCFLGSFLVFCLLSKWLFLRGFFVEYVVVLVYSDISRSTTTTLHDILFSALVLFFFLFS